MLKKFVESIIPGVSPLDGNTIEDEERVTFAVVAAARIGNHIEKIDWSDSIIQRCRFDSTTISNSSFERVAILDCDLSGVTFNNCLFRECLIMGIKANSHLAFENCILDRMMMTRSRTQKLEIHNSSIAQLDFLGLESIEVNFHQCRPHKRKGQTSFEECEFEKVCGLDALGKEGIEVQVDAPMWRDLGDYYVKERGIKPLHNEPSNPVTSRYALLDEIGLP